MGGAKTFCIVPKSMKHRPKIVPKLVQNRSKIGSKSSQNRRLGVVLGALGTSWGGLGEFFQSVGVHLAFQLGILGRLGSLLGCLGSKQVANMGPTWLPKQVQHRPKSKQKAIQILMPLGLWFFEDFGGFVGYW